MLVQDIKSKQDDRGLPGNHCMDGGLQQNRRWCHGPEEPATRLTFVFKACPNGQRSRIPGKKLHLILCGCGVCLCTQIGGEMMQKIQTCDFVCSWKSICADCPIISRAQKRTGLTLNKYYLYMPQLKWIKVCKSIFLRFLSSLTFSTDCLSLTMWSRTPLQQQVEVTAIVRSWWQLGNSAFDRVFLSACRPEKCYGQTDGYTRSLEHPSCTNNVYE